MRQIRETPRPALLVAAALVALAAAADARPAAPIAQAPATSGEVFRWSGQVAPGQTVEIKGVNGGIEAGPSTSGQVEVVATKDGKRSDPRLVKVEVVPHAGGVTICAVYPTPAGEEPNRCAPGREGRMNTRDNDVRVGFVVRVPAGALLAAKTVNGGVTVRDLDARVDVHTVNGGVELATQATGSAHTVNGSISATIGRADWEDTLELKTVNGSITLGLPASADARVTASTVNGRITSDLPLTVEELSRRTLKGTLGSGGRHLSLGTVNGSITLKAGP